jgi:polyisoprenoid-binding protein YceI
MLKRVFESSPWSLSTDEVAKHSLSSPSRRAERYCTAPLAVGYRAFVKWLLVFLAWAPVCSAEGRGYRVDPRQCEVAIHVGKSGLLKFAGHEHEVIAPAFSGTIVADPASLEKSSVALAFDAKALKVLEKGEPPGDAAKVEAVMIGPSVLDAVHFADISFVSRTVSGREVSPGTYDIRVQGDLALHGVTKPLTLPMRVELREDRLRVSGRMTLKQSDFGIRPVSVAGVVNVRDEVAITFSFVGVPDLGTSPGGSPAYNPRRFWR